ncbi:MAG: hypothetical protein U0169_26820 [Polyangiaceae bacterium]
MRLRFPRTSTSLPALVLPLATGWAGITLVTACSSVPNVPPAPVQDAGSDTGAKAEGGTSSDAGTPDAGNDGATGTDAGGGDASADAGPRDGSTGMDATVGDGGAHTDSGAFDGGFPPFDGGDSFDGSFPPFDGGDPFDGSFPPFDGGPPGDAGPPDGSGAPFGAPCQGSNTCASNFCREVSTSGSGYCSEFCTQSTTCETASAGSKCIAAQGPAASCAPSCTRASDCTPFGPNSSCRQNLTTEGTVSNACGVYLSQIPGAPCLDNGQCAGGACNTIWCADACANDAVCGASASCLLNNNQAYTCFPTCNVDADCIQYGLGNQLRCQSATSRDGATVKVCSG